MKYKTATAFRQALEGRLREQSLKTGVPLVRLRKMVAFDRLLARLVKKDKHAWIIKGGLAMQLRMGDVARTTKDVDASILRTAKAQEAAALFRRAAAGKVEDWFEFEVEDPSPTVTGAPSGGLRFPIHCLLDGRTFERFHFDVGIGDVMADKADELRLPAILEFAGMPPTTVLCYSVTSQIAEKLHAYTRPYAGGESSRVRDLVDIALLASRSRVNARRLQRALQATFDARATHPMPTELPQPPAGWSSPYKKLSRDLNLQWPAIEDVAEACGRFLNPVLAASKASTWDPDSWCWR